MLFETRRKSALSLAAVMLAVLLAGSATAQEAPVEQVRPNEPVFTVTSKDTHLQIVETFTKVVELRSRITRVDGFDPEVLNVSGLSANRLRVQALAPGVTTMVIVDEHDNTYAVEVFVAGDVRHLQAYIARLFPNSSVEAVKVRDSVVLRGWVAKPEHITELVEIAEQFFPNVLNQMKVGGVQQVLMKVRVMEVQRSVIRQFGFNFLFTGEDGFLTSTPGQLTPIGGISLGPPPSVSVNSNSLSDPTISFGVINPNSAFQGFLEALKQESLLKIMAEPELVTTNGRPANMLAGGEFPVLVPQSLGTVTIEWREFGVRLEAVPIILGGGRVRLELQPEVSERDFTNSVTLNGTTVPGLTTRRVNTQVEMNFGQTFMIAGLLSTRRTATASKVPFLGELPVVGAAFRRERFDDAETELVIMVTPELIAPLNCDQVPPGGPGLFTDTPTDRELYCDGLLEVPNYGDHCGANCGPGNSGSIYTPISTPNYPTPAGPAIEGTSPSMLPPNPAPEAPGHSLPVPAPAADDAPPAGSAPPAATLEEGTPQSSTSVEPFGSSSPMGRLANGMNRKRVARESAGTPAAETPAPGFTGNKSPAAAAMGGDWKPTSKRPGLIAPSTTAN